MEYKIKEMRIARNMTQESLCKNAAISRQTLSDLENGKDVNTTMQTLKKIADALNCSIGDIFCG